MLVEQIAMVTNTVKNIIVLINRLILFCFNDLHDKSAKQP